MNKPSMVSKPKNMKELAETSAKLDYEGARAIANTLHKELVVDLPRQKLPEAVFVEYFLDYFMYPKKYKDTPILSRWLELAGGPYNEVDIFDDLGTVIFTTPGVILKPVVNSAELSKYNFISIANTYLLKKNITRAQGTNYLNSVLSGLDQSIHGLITDHINRWSYIFARYTKPAPLKKQPKAKVELPNTPNASIFDL